MSKNKPVEPAPKEASAEKAKAPWSHRMLFEEIATRIRSAMETKDVSIFELAKKLRWSPARVLMWIDGSMARRDMQESEDGTLGEAVSIGMALGFRWDFDIGKLPNKEPSL